MRSAKKKPNSIEYLKLLSKCVQPSIDNDYSDQPDSDIDIVNSDSDSIYNWLVCNVELQKAYYLTRNEADSPLTKDKLPKMPINV